MSKLLVVDDEESIAWGIKRLAEGLGHKVTIASSAEQAMTELASDTPDVVVLDVRLPGMDGLEALGRLKEHHRELPVILMTAYGDLPTAVEAVRLGAFEYLHKPFNLDDVQSALERALAARPVPKEVAQVTERGGIIGRSPVMQDVFKRIALAAASDANVLISGESGTGKELAAMAMHQFSTRRDEPFVAVNVASLSPSLVESELFGHVKGAFTGAAENRTGLLAQANGGTLFLDEVADIPLPTQVKLLRAIEQDEVTPVGSSRPTPSAFRIVAATHQKLLEVVGRGDFRHDLYFRLAAFHIEMPPLRSRGDDVALLASHFLAQFAERSEGPRAQMSSEFITELERRPWYGNVRELRNAVEHALVLARGEVLMPAHLPKPVTAEFVESTAEIGQQLTTAVRDWVEQRLRENENGEGLYEELLEIIEPPLLSETLKHCGGQYLGAAKRLGMHRTTVKKKLQQHGLEEGGESEE